MKNAQGVKPFQSQRLFPLLFLCCLVSKTGYAQSGTSTLEGINMYDLVLINRHILGLAPFKNPYQILAADVNRNQFISIFDVIELQKLILGKCQQLPDNISWRYVPEAFVFPNPANPFQGIFPEQSELELSQRAPSAEKMQAIKVGDVSRMNIKHITGGTSVGYAVGTLPLGYASAQASPAEPLEIPLFVQQATDLAAWQLALHYDTTQIKIKNVRWAMSAEPSPYEMADWFSPVSGELRLSWFDRQGEIMHLAPQSIIAYLQVERLQNGTADAHIALQVIQTIPGEAYGHDGQITGFVLNAVQDYQAPAIPVKVIKAKPQWTVLAYPNPTNGLFRLEINLPLAGAGHIGIYDPLGRLVAQQDCPFLPGLNVVASQQFPTLHPGIYFVRISTPMGRQTLRLVRY